MKKIDYKHGKFTILTSIIDTDGFDREDYIDFCEANGTEAGVVCGGNESQLRERYAGD